MFTKGNHRSKTNVIKGLLENHRIQIFNYDFEIGSGKNRIPYSYTVFEIDYDNRIPKMFLRVDKNAWQMFKPSFVNGRRLNLEGNFDDFFDLFVENDFEIEALQIFTPDIMQKLMTDWKQFTLEFTGDKIYIYTTFHIDKSKNLEAMHSLAKFLIDKLSIVIKRMEPSTLAMEKQIFNK